MLRHLDGQALFQNLIHKREPAVNRSRFPEKTADGRDHIHFTIKTGKGEKSLWGSSFWHL